MPVFTRPAVAGRTDQPGRKGDGSGLTIIAIGTQITGDVVSDAVVKVEGIIEGTVRAGTQLLVARGAVIRGDAFAAEIVVGGEVQGGLQASERIEVQAGAVVHGDITTQRIQIQEGGLVNGQITMELPRSPSSAGERSPATSARHE